MSKRIFFNELNVGDNWRSQGRTITESDVVNFATLTGDFDPLHVDEEFSSQGPYGQRIAHGLLGISFMAGLNYQCPPMQNIAFVKIREWQFLKPIYFGDTIYGYAEVIDLKPHFNRRGLVVWQRTLYNQRDEAVQGGIVETLVAVSPEYKSQAAPR